MIAYTYDDQGRIKTEADYNNANDAGAGQNAVKTITYAYDQLDGNTDRTFDTVTVTDTKSFNDNGTTTTYYDAEGRTVEVDTPANGSEPQGKIFYEYDPANGQKSRTYTGSASNPTTDISYAYDSTGRLAKVIVNALNGAPLAMPLETDYFYDLDDDLVATREVNGTFEYRTYDTLNRLLQVETVSASGTVLAGFTYSLDAAGQRTGEVSDAGRSVTVGHTATGDVTLTLSGSAGRTVAYTYDADGRLTQEAITNVPNTYDRTISYTYDLAGNQRSKQDFTNGGVQDYTITYTDDADDRLVDASLAPRYPSAAGGQGGISPSDTQYTYDLDGNTLTAMVTTNNGVRTLSTTTNIWNIDGTLARVMTTDNTKSTTTTTDFAYDAAGNRVAQRTGGVTTSYLNDPSEAYDQALEEYSGGMRAATYVRGLDLLFEDRTGADGGSSGRSFYAVDGLSSTRALVNSSGSVTDTITYDAFGNTIAQTGSTTNPYLYADQSLDAATGLYHMGARYYEASAGRFTSRDSFGGQTTNPITLNHYIYAGASPVDNIDPTGHDFSLSESITVGAVIGGIAGFGYGYIRGARQSGSYLSAQAFTYGLVGGVVGAGLGAAAGGIGYYFYTGMLNPILSSASRGTFFWELSAAVTHPTIQKSFVVGLVAGAIFGAAVPDDGQVIASTLIGITEGLAASVILGHIDVAIGDLHNLPKAVDGLRTWYLLSPALLKKRTSQPERNFGVPDETRQ